MNTHHRSHLFRNILLVVIFVTISIAIFVLMPARHHYHISPETTFITSPVRSDGYIDYVTALNEHVRGDITPDENANVLIWQAIGPKPQQGTNMSPEYFEWLGIPEPSEEGDYLIGWNQFLDSLEDKENPSDRDELELKRRLSDWARKCPWKAENEPELAEWLCGNQAPLELIARASKRTRFYNPIVPSHSEKSYFKSFNGLLFGARLDNFSVCREAAEMLVCRAMLHLGEDRVDEAWEDLMTCHRLGRLIEQGGTTSEFDFGARIRRIAEQGELVFLSQAKLSPSKIASCRNDLNQQTPQSKYSDKINIAYRLMTLDLIQHLARNGLGTLIEINRWNCSAPQLNSSQYLDQSIVLNLTMRVVNNWLDRSVAIFKIKDDQTRLDGFAELEAELDAMNSEMQQQAWILPLLGAKQRGELLGKIVIASWMPYPGNVILRDVQHTQHHHNLTVAFALAAYWADHGKYPEQLRELTPKYLSQIPDDILADAPLNYLSDEDGYQLFSLGTNRLIETNPRRGKSRSCFGERVFKNDLVIVMPLEMPKRPGSDPVDPNEP